MATERVQKILDRLNKQKKSADISNLDPETIQAIINLDASMKKDDPEGKDYMTLCREHKLKYGVTLTDAMRWVEKNYPHKLREYIKKHNPEM